jgi:hypothetical protein
MKKRIINMKFFCVFFMMLLMILSLSFILSHGTRDTGFKVDGGKSITIDVWEPCKVVENTIAQDQFVSTKTSGEWSSFINNKPYGISLSKCTYCTPGDFVYVQSTSHNPEEGWELADNDCYCPQGYGPIGSRYISSTPSSTNIGKFYHMKTKLQSYEHSACACESWPKTSTNEYWEILNCWRKFECNCLNGEQPFYEYRRPSTKVIFDQANSTCENMIDGENIIKSELAEANAENWNEISILRGWLLNSLKNPTKFTKDNWCPNEIIDSWKGADMTERGGDPCIEDIPKSHTHYPICKVLVCEE